MIATEQPSVEHGTQWHFDRLMGRTVYQQMINDGASVDAVMDGWSAYCDEFCRLREPYLIYS